MKAIGRRILVIGLLGPAAVACAPEREKPPRISEVRNYNAKYVCDGDQPVQVHFTPFAAVLESQDMSVEMTQQPVADGFLYTGGGQSLRAHDDEAVWSDAKGAIRHCHDAAATGGAAAR
jgi:hypothetical protein